MQLVEEATPNRTPLKFWYSDPEKFSPPVQVKHWGYFAAI
jgi:hypothetical protein